MAKGNGGAVGLGAFGSLAMMVLIGSSTAVAAKIAVREIPVGLVPMVRFGVAGLILWPIVARGDVLMRMFREDRWRLLLAAAFCVPINQALFLNGARFAPAGHIGMIYAAVPLVVLGLATAIGQERLTGRKILGVLASVVGVGLIALENVWRGGSGGRDVLLGDLLEVGAVLAWGSYLAVNKPLVARFGAMPTLAATFLVGSLLDLPIAMATAPGWPPLSEISPAAWGALLYLTFAISIAGLAFQNLAMKKLDASQVATFGNVAPLLTVLWGFLLFGERISPVAAVGGGLVLLGIAGIASRGRSVALPISLTKPGHAAIPAVQPAA
ncbi:DMT family transporter [Tundrisphaera sp. TA3]|uniref:DMT family transporter n=1 Tax=Tundrisphaera sp. TA3 TaxID=3435775 RepID=UPI003EBC1561